MTRKLTSRVQKAGLHGKRHSARLVVERLEDRSLLSAGLQVAYGQLPLAFEANQGQAGSQVDYQARGSGYTVSLSGSGAELALQTPGVQSTTDVLKLRLVGGNPGAVVAGQDELVTKSNFLAGSDPSQWHTDVPNFGRVEYRNVYDGINLVYYGNQGQLEYDFTVAPGADPNAIRLGVQGAKGLGLDALGELLLHTSSGDVVEHAPVLYQDVNGIRQAVSGRFVLEGDNEVGFQVDAYDPSQPLTIDPTLSYSTYLGGSGAVGYAIAVDSSGEAFVTGAVTGGGGSFMGYGVFVDKLNAAGTALLYQTFLGNGGSQSPGSNGSGGSGIAVDAAGDAFVTGLPGLNFPTTANALQATAPAGTTGFVTILNPAGSSLLYSTYLPGVTVTPYYGPGAAIAIDGAGNALVTGAASTGLPTTAGAFQSSYGGATDAFFAKINPNLSGPPALVYSSYLGGSNADTGTGIAVDASGNAYVSGYTFSTNLPTTAGAFQGAIAGRSNVFVAKFNPSLSGQGSLVYSTYLGGNGRDGYYTAGSATVWSQTGPGIAVDGAGNSFVAGVTTSSNFPTTPGAFETTYHGGVNQTAGDGFVTKLNPTGTGLVYSTYLGGTSKDGASSIAVDGSGNAVVTGWTRSTDFPTVNPLQAHIQPGNDNNNIQNSDVFVATLNSAGNGLLFATYLGGTGNDFGYGLALDPSANIYVTGNTVSANFPVTAGALQTSPGGGFVFKIVNPPAIGSFAVSGFPSPITAGTGGTITVTALDTSNNVMTGYAGTVHFTSSDPQAVLPADYTFTPADQGVHTFTVTLKTAGSQSITAGDGANGLVGAQSGIAVNPAAATHFSISAPASVTHGVAFTITVTALDAFGNVATGYTGTVHFTSTDSTATLPPSYTFTAGDGGVHTFVNLTTLRKKGTKTITVTDTLNSALTGSDAIVVV